MRFTIRIVWDFQPYRKNGKEKTIGVVCPEIDNAFYSQIVNEIIRISAENGYNCSVFSSNFNYSFEESATRYLSRTGATGILFVCGEIYKDQLMTKNLSVSGIPLVGIGMGNNVELFDNVFINEQAGFDDAINYLKNLGHSKIAFIGDEYGKERLEFFKKSLQKCELYYDIELVFLGKSRNFLCGYEGANALLNKDFSALCCQYDDIVLGAIRAFKDKKIHVPEKISVIGFEGASYVNYTSPKITTIKSNPKEICSIAFEMLKNRIEGKKYPAKNVFFSPSLSIGETTYDIKVSQLIKK